MAKFGYIKFGGVYKGFRVLFSLALYDWRFSVFKKIKVNEELRFVKGGGREELKLAMGCKSNSTKF